MDATRVDPISRAVPWSVRTAALPAGLSLREKLLALRDIPDGQERDVFFHPAPHTCLPSLLGDPTTLPDAAPAVDRILSAIEAGERICIYGDYDADGVTATAILVRGLRQLGGRVEYYLPHRVDEGFGLNETAVRKLAQEGVDLLTTADCGTSDTTEAAIARSLGMDVIVTDHHSLPATLPEAVAVINPRRPEGDYPFRQLTGAGVAYSLLRAVAYRSPRREAISGGDLIQLAAVGTIADMAPLVGENRLLVRAGLVPLNGSPLPGLRALIESAALSGYPVTETDVSFKIAPRLNAAGRMDHPDLACDLLLASDPWKARELAFRLDRLNSERRTTTDGMIVSARSMVDGGDALSGDVLTIYREDWSPALLGIVAGQLSRLHSMPVIAATGDGENVRASARSVPGLDLMVALDGCSNLLAEHGGHAQAAGFTTTHAGLKAVHQHLNTVFGGTRRQALLEVDVELAAGDISGALAEDLGALAPFGIGNPEPLFGLRGVTPLWPRAFGKEGAHLSFRIPSAGGLQSEVVGFGLANKRPSLSRSRPVDLVVRALRQRNGTFNPPRFCLERILP